MKDEPNEIEGIEPKKEIVPKGVVGLIHDDLSNLQEIMRYYELEMKGYEENLRIDMKTYSKANSEQAGWLSHYDQIRCELEVIHDDMEMRYGVIRANAFSELIKHDAKAYTEKQMQMAIDKHPNVIKHNKTINEIAERLKKAKSIVVAFVQRGHSLSNFTKIRAGEFHNERMYVDIDK